MHAQYRVRRLHIADLNRILEIERASFGDEAYDRNLFAEFFRTCGELFLVAEHGRKVRGYMITCIRGDRAELVSVAVDPAARGIGVGRALATACVELARGTGRHGVAIYTRPSMTVAHRMYETLGFVRERSRDWEFEPGEWLWSYVLAL